MRCRHLSTNVKRLPAPFLCSEMQIEPQWIDYNGHLNMAYYNVIMDRSIDELFAAGDRAGLSEDPPDVDHDGRMPRPLSPRGPSRRSAGVDPARRPRMKSAFTPSRSCAMRRRLAVGHLGKHLAVDRHDSAEGLAVSARYRRAHLRRGRTQTCTARRRRPGHRPARGRDAETSRRDSGTGRWSRFAKHPVGTLP